MEFQGTDGNFDTKFWAKRRLYSEKRSGLKRTSWIVSRKQFIGSSRICRENTNKQTWWCLFVLCKFNRRMTKCHCECVFWREWILMDLGCTVSNSSFVMDLRIILANHSRGSWHQNMLLLIINGYTETLRCLPLYIKSVHYFWINRRDWANWDSQHICIL